MKALIYLLLTSIKNKILILKSKPVYLTLYIGVTLYIILIFSAIIRTQANLSQEQNFMDIHILYLILAGLVFLVAYTNISKGLSKGNTLFNMADAGLLFPSPVSPKKVLFYGLTKQMGITLLSSLFVLFQLYNVKLNFEVSNRDTIFLFFVYCLVLFYSHLLSMVIYMLINNKNTNKKTVNVIILSTYILLFLVICNQYIKSDGNILSALYLAVDSKLFQAIPICGWSIMLFSSILENNILKIIVSSLLFIISGIAMIRLFITKKDDYYEDILLSTEDNYIAVQDNKDGKSNQNNKNVKTSKHSTGFKAGRGATVLFFKEILIAKRISKVPFVDHFTILSVSGYLLYYYFAKESFNIYIIFSFLVYIQFFQTVKGPLYKELLKPYIYLIPESSLRKLIFASMPSLIKPAVDGTIIFVLIGIVSKTPLILIIFLISAYVSSAAMCLSNTILWQRILGSQPNMLIQIMVGLPIAMIILSPGIILSMILSGLLPAHLSFLVILPFILNCVLFTIFAFGCCRNLIDNAEV